MCKKCEAVESRPTCQVTVRAVGGGKDMVTWVVASHLNMEPPKDKAFGRGGPCMALGGSWAPFETLGRWLSGAEL